LLPPWHASFYWDWAPLIQYTPNHGSTYTITAVVSNTAGKQAIDNNNGLFIDIASPDIPTVLNNYAGTTTPTLTGAAMKAVPGTPVSYIALAAGDTLTLTVGGATYTGTVGSLPAGLTYDATTHEWSLNTVAATPASGILTLVSGNTYDVGITVTSGGVSNHDTSAGELIINTVDPTITLDAISGGYINAVEKGQTLTLTGTTNAQVGSHVTITGLDSIIYPATVLAGASGQPNTFSITVPAANVTAFSADGSTLTATATVTNLYNRIGTDTENVVIDTTGPAFSSAATATVVENTATTVAIYDADASDNHSVTYSLKGTGDDGQFNIDSATGVVKLNTAADHETKASYNFTVVATDAAGTLTVVTADGTTQVISVVITGTNDAPVLANALADTTATAGAALSYTVPANAFSDVDSASLSYTAVVVDGSGNALSTQPSWFSFNPSTRIASGTPPAGSGGSTFNVKVTASDDRQHGGVPCARCTDSLCQYFWRASS
jgi:VCBS repeat-containing protein